MENMIDQYLTKYYEEYDEYDKYFDFIYSIYEQINKEINERYYSILDNMSFQDFFDFYIEHMNIPIVDNLIISNHIQEYKQIKRSKSSSYDIDDD